MIEKTGLARHQFPSVDVPVSQSVALPAKLINICRGMSKTGETPLEDRSHERASRSQEVRIQSGRVLKSSDPEPRLSLLRKNKQTNKKNLSDGVSCSRGRDRKESLVLSAGLSTWGCCSSARRAESHGTAASAWKFMLIESEAAAMSASSLPAPFSRRGFFFLPSSDG